MRNRKRTPEEVLNALEEHAVDDEVERVMSLSEAELDRELAQAGFDPKEVAARGAELAREQLAKHRPAAGADESRARSRRVWRRLVDLPAAAALSLASLATAAFMEIAIIAQPGLEGSSAVVTPPVLDAGELRREAFRACDDHRWDACKAGLDQAKKLDPGGEDRADVRAARRRIAEARGL